MTRQERIAGTRATRNATAGISVPEIATTLQVPEAAVRAYLATQTFRGVRLTFVQRRESRRNARQWRQWPLKGM
ncbi:MAG: hypothetical protein M3Y58_12415 [Chloroflexota bacterium]|nr:hypothetical protein [Chloroflexota bacterium]